MKNLILTAVLGVICGAALVTPASAAPSVSAEKDDGIDAGTRKRAGDTITYTVTISNSSGEEVTDALGVTLTDNTPAHTELVAGSVKVTPIAFDDAYDVVGNTRRTVAASSGVLANDVDPDELNAFANGHLRVKADSVARISGTTTGTFVLAVDGSFNYTPEVGVASGTERFSYIVLDADDQESVSVGYVDLTISGRVWYVRNGGTGDGRSDTPLGSPVTASVQATEATDIIYVLYDSGTLNGAFALDSGQQLLGEGVALEVNGLPIFPAGSVPTIANNAGAAVTLGANNTLRGFHIGNSTGPAVVGTDVGALTINSLSVNTTGAGLDLSGELNPVVSIALTGLTSAGGSKNVNLVGLGGTITLGTGSLTGALENAFEVSGGTASIAYSGTISNTRAHAVSVSGKSGGGVTLSGAITNNSSGRGINLVSNPGTTIAFSGPLTLNTGANTAFNATGGGTITATASGSTITTSAGTAVNIVDTIIGVGGVTLQTVNSNGGYAGIVLDNTGTSGGTFAITGVDSNYGSGGTITNKSGDAIYLHTTRNVTLRCMTVSNSGGSHIDATGVVGLTLNRVNTDNSVDHGIKGSSITDLVILNGTFDRGGAANPSANFDGIHITNLLGTSSIHGARFARSNTRQVYVVNNTAIQYNGNPDTLTVTATAWDNHTGPFAGDHLSILADSGANFRLVVKGDFGSNIIDGGGVGVQAAAGGTNGKLDLSVSQLRTTNNTAGVVVGQSGEGVVTYNIANNSGADGFSGTGSVAIAVIQTGAGSCRGTISNNSIAHTAGPTTNALQVIVEGGGTGTAVISNNIVTGNFQRGIHAQARAGSGVLNLTVSGNRLDGTDNTGQGLQVVSIESGGSAITSTNTIRLNLSGNTANGGSYLAGYRLVNRALCTFQLQNFTGNGLSTTDVEDWVTTIKENSSNVSLKKVSVVASAPFSATAGSVPVPLMYVPGGVEPVMAAPRVIVKTSREPEAVESPAPARSEAGVDALSVQARPAVLTQSGLDFAVAAALSRWEAAGLRPEQLAVLRSLRFEVADLPGWYLGEAAGIRIRLDADAGGNGWFADASEGSDAHFANVVSVSRHYTDPVGAPAGCVDLLTAIMHEMGHALGLDDTYLPRDRDDLMFGHLSTGERRFPVAGQADRATSFSTDVIRFLSAPLSLGTLPPGKSVRVTYAVTINAAVPTISGQGTVSGSGFSVLTDDPEGAGETDPTVTRVHVPPTLANVAPSVVEDGVLTFSAALFDAGFSDGNGDTLHSVSIESLPANGQLRLNGSAFTVPQTIARGSIPSLTFVPGSDYFGSSGFMWSATDSSVAGLSAVEPAAVNLTVVPVADAPVIAAATVAEDTQSSAGLVITRNVVDGAEVTHFKITNSVNGIVFLNDGTTAVADSSFITIAQAEAGLRFTPARDLNTPAGDTFSFDVQAATSSAGAGLSSITTVGVTVTEVNDAPTATDDTLSAVDEGSGPRSISSASLLANDLAGPANESGQTVTVTAVSDPVGGTVEIVGADVIFTLASEFNGTAGFDYTITDNGTSDGSPDPLSAVGHVSFPVTALNGPPVLVGAINAAGWREGDTTVGAGFAGDPVFLFSEAVVSDDATGLTGAALTVAFDAYEPGDLLSLPPSTALGADTLTYDSGTSEIRFNGTWIASASGGFGSALVITFRSGAVIAHANAILGTIVYNYYGDDNPTAFGSHTSRNVTVTLDDGGNTGAGGAQTSSALTGTLTITAVNDAPAIAATNDSAIEDVDAALDTFVFSDPDAAPGSSLMTATVSVGSGTLTATSSGVVTVVSGSGTGTLTLSGTLNALNGYVAASRIQFKTAPNSDQNVSATVTIDDGGATGREPATGATGTATSEAASRTITIVVTPVNDSPTTNPVCGYVNTGVAVPVGGLETIADTMLHEGDPDDSGTGITYTITTAPSYGTLFIDANANGIVDGGEALASADTFTQNDIDESRIRYLHGGGAGSQDSVRFSVADGGEDGSVALTGLTFIITIAEAPVLSTGGGSARIYVEDGPAVEIGGGITITDGDSITLGGATITITDFLTGDLLGFTNQNGIAGSYNAATGVLALSGTATRAQYQAALRTVVYSSTNPNPATGIGNSDRIIRFTVTDDTGLTSLGVNITVLVQNTNDAPVLDASLSLALADILEDLAAPTLGRTAGSTLVSALLGGVSDPDVGALQGVAIIGTTTQGTLWYSIDNGGTWSQAPAVTAASALLLQSDARVYLQPAPNVNGLIADVLTFKAWDRTSGANGGTADVTTSGGATAFSSVADAVAVVIVGINDAPTLAGGPFVLAATDEDTTSSGTRVSAILAGLTYVDVDSGALSGIAITAFVGNGTWQYSTDGVNWNGVGSVLPDASLLLSSATQVRYVPDGIGAEDARLTFRAWDQTSGTASDNTTRRTADVTTNGGTTAFSTGIAEARIVIAGINDAPVLTPILPSLTDITEDDTANVGQTVASFRSGSVSDVDNVVGGIAITSTMSGNGTWQFSLDGGGSWSAMGAVTNASALVLRAGDLIRFVPDGLNGTVGSITYRACDHTGVAFNKHGARIDASIAGETTPLSSATDTATIAVTSVNDAPTGADRTITTSEGGACTFAASDFGFLDVDTGDALSAVRIDTLPGAGALTLSGAPVAVGQIVDAPSLGALVFTSAPDAIGAGYASFTFSVRDQSSAYALAPSTITLNVPAKEATITLGGLAHTYDGTQKSATATTMPVGLAVKFTYDGDTTAPTDAGEYAVVATIDEDDYTGQAGGTLTIAKAGQTIAFVAVGSVQPRDSIGLSATASSGLPVTFSVIRGPATVSGGTLAVTGGGEIVVRASQPGGPNHLAATDVDQTIASTKLAQTITFGELADRPASDGPVALNATASSGLPVVFTIVEGPATIVGTTLTPTGNPGTVIVRASQPGDAVYAAAADVLRSFEVEAEGLRVFFGELVSGAEKAGGASPQQPLARSITKVGDVAAVLSADRTTGSLMFVAPDIGIDELAPFTLAADGSFVASVTQKAGQNAPAERRFVVRGQIVAGVLSGLIENTDHTFRLELEARDGPSAASAGLYSSIVLGTGSGQIHTIVGTDNRVLILILTPAFTGGGMTTLNASGAFVLALQTETASGGISGRLDPVGATLHGSIVFEGQAPASFRGVQDGVARTDRLINLSARGRVGEGENLLVSGFVIQGTQPLPVLVRAVGPGLTDLGVAQALPNPQIHLYRKNSVIAENDDWSLGQDPAEVARAMARTGALGIGEGSADAALLVTLDPGIYTVHVTAAANSPQGVALAEVYDASDSPDPVANRLINISSRAEVGTGDNILIGGFVVFGNAAKRVLIRGVGPSLSAQGILVPVADPVIHVYQGHTVVAHNDDWDDDPIAATENAAAARVTGAFALPVGSSDAAMILTLAPGVYTVHVTAKPGTAAGVGLVEIYEIPNESSR